MPSQGHDKDKDSMREPEHKCPAARRQESRGRDGDLAAAGSMSFKVEASHVGTLCACYTSLSIYIYTHIHMYIYTYYSLYNICTGNVGIIISGDCRGVWGCDGCNELDEWWLARVYSVPESWSLKGPNTLRRSNLIEVCVKNKHDYSAAHKSCIKSSSSSAIMAPVR